MTELDGSSAFRLRQQDCAVRLTLRLKSQRYGLVGPAMGSTPRRQRKHHWRAARPVGRSEIGGMRRQHRTATPL